MECPFVGLIHRCYRQCRRYCSVVRVSWADWTMFYPAVHQDPIQVSPTLHTFLFPRKESVKFGASLFTAVSWVSCPRLKQTSHAWSYKIFALFLMLKKRNTAFHKTYLLKTWWWISHLFKHCPLDCCLSDISIIFSGALGTTRSTSWSFITWFIEVWFCHQY